MEVVRVLGKLEPGGAQLATLRLARELERSHGVRARLVVGDASEDGMRLAERHGIQPIAYRTHTTIPSPHNLQWELSHRFVDWLEGQVDGADLVHAHMVGAWWAAAQACAARTSLIATEHNQVNWPPQRTRSLRAAAARIDRFYAMGPAARRFAVAAGVRVDVIAAARSPVAGLYARPHDRARVPRLTFAGRFCADKGPDVLVEALALLHCNDLSVYLLGDGPMREALSERTRRLGLADRVLLPGWVDRPWTYIAGSAVHVVPSREEAWSQSAVLALGLGVPVIGTRVDGLAETLSNSRGLLVAPDDPTALAEAISRVLARDIALDRAGAMRYARQFTATRVASFYFAEYQAMLSEPSRVGR